MTTPPFGGQPGEASRLTAAGVRDIVAFLGTPTDGWRAPLPRASR